MTVLERLAATNVGIAFLALALATFKASGVPFYKFLQDQGSIIAGLLALAAGIAAYSAGARQARAGEEQARAAFEQTAQQRMFERFRQSREIVVATRIMRAICSQVSIDFETIHIDRREPMAVPLDTVLPWLALMTPEFVQRYSDIRSRVDRLRGVGRIIMPPALFNEYNVILAGLRDLNTLLDDIEQNAGVDAASIT